MGDVGAIRYNDLESSNERDMAGAADDVVLSWRMRWIYMFWKFLVVVTLATASGRGCSLSSRRGYGVHYVNLYN
jgi:hypothetical protein